MDQLHVDVFGVGDPAIFIHGSFGRGLETIPEQRALSDEYRIILVDRRGFGGSSPLEAEGWLADMRAGSESVTVSVPRAWRSRVAITWGNTTGIVQTLRIAGCGTDPSAGNAYAGGFYLR